MIEKCELELELSNTDKKFLEAVVKTLKPDTYSLPKDCFIDLNIFETKLIIKISCREISNLRALFFSYFTIISTILDLGDVLN